MHHDPLATWEQGTIAAEIEIAKDINVKQTRLECPWCDKKHLVTMDKTRRARGHMMCSNCGQFFKWIVQDERGATRRVIGKLKKGTVPWQDSKGQPVATVSQ